MNLFKKTVMKGGFYTFLISLSWLLISKLINFDKFDNYNIVMDLSLLGMLTLFGYAIAAVGLIFETRLDPIFKRAIHFLVLLCGFVFVFMNANTDTVNNGKKVFIAIVIFAMVYPVLTLLIFGLKKLMDLIEGKIDEKKAKPEESDKNNGDKGYKPLYK